MSKERVNQINDLIHIGSTVIAVAVAIIGAAIGNIALILMALGIWGAGADIEIVSKEEVK